MRNSPKEGAIIFPFKRPYKAAYYYMLACMAVYEVSNKTICVHIVMNITTIFSVLHFLECTRVVINFNLKI